MRSLVLASALVVAAGAATTGTAAASAIPSVRSAPVTHPASAAPNPGGIGLRLMDVPTAAAEDPRARLYIVDHLAPGTVINRRVEVSNTTKAPVRVSMYSAAADIKDGSFTGAAGRTPNELSTWTTLSQGTVNLAPGAKAPNTVTIAVPADAAPGEQYAVVWAEIGSSGEGVNLVNRVGLRLYVSVGEGNAPAASFDIESVTATRDAEGHPVVTAEVRNDGGRALDMSGTLTLSDGPGSMSAGPFPARLGSTLAPGQSTAVTIPLDRQLPAGPWTAALALLSGQLEKSARASIEFPSGPGSSFTTRLREHPEIWFALLVLLVLTITAGYILRRRRIRIQRSEP
ncbi:MAG: hypothetical protein ACT4O0_18790 [Pseudonocardia sp.]